MFPPTNTPASQPPLTWEIAEQQIANHSVFIESDELVNVPLVTVVLVTYNQSSFVRQGLESILEQETEYPFEILIGDDCSNDGTLEIIKDYQQRHPDKIRLLLFKENLGRMTGNGRLNMIANLRAARGKYIAILEGDDYWCDPHKLQNQIHALESNDHLGGSIHDTQIIYENENRPPRRWYFNYGTRVEFQQDDTLDYTPICHTSSLVFRKTALPDPLPDWFIHIPSADMVLFALAAKEGTLLRIPGQCSVYRRNEFGVTNTTGFHKNIGLLINRYYTVRCLVRHVGGFRWQKAFRVKTVCLIKIALQIGRAPLHSIRQLVRHRSWIGFWGMFGLIPAMLISAPVALIRALKRFIRK